jgi:dTDP-4-dehydrorhamnose 3,5-epimerase-like enzyme
MRITDALWMRLQHAPDSRGSLTAIEGGQHVPFQIERAFYMHHVVPGADRGGHAHRDTDQFAVAVNGALKITISDGLSVRTVLLDTPNWGVYLPRMTWTRLFDFSDSAVCLVLASTHYDSSRSIRTWGEYLEFRSVPSKPEPETGPLLSRPRS